jgi:hypothetical protein
MQNEKLQTMISELEKELSGLPSVDDESRQRLLETIQELRSRLKENTGSQPARPLVTDRLQAVVEKFEGSHPTLTLTLSRLIDALGEIGI